MSTIPADPTMVLGQIVSMEKLNLLQEMGDALKPQVTARDKFDALMLAVHNLEGLFLELTNMNVDSKALQKMRKEIDKIKKQLTEAAVQLATITVECQTKVAEIRATGSTIGISPESPYDMTQVEVKGAPVSMDSIKFDVQFFRTESQDDNSSSNSTAKAVSAFIQGSAESGKANAELAHKSMKATEAQHSKHKVEGTLVIVCNCTHKIANFLNGTMDSRRAVEAWNQTFPEEYLDTDPISLIKAAMSSKKGEKGLHILTGTTFGSSFVGLAHVLETEESSSSSTSERGSSTTKGSAESKDLAKKVGNLIKEDMFLQEMSGNFGMSREFAKNAKSLFSKSEINAHCTMICQGAVPGIKSRDHSTFVKQMEPSTLQNFEKINALNAESDATNDDTGGAQAKLGQQLISMDGEFLKGAANTFKEDKTSNIKYFDLESLMEAFENYLKIVRGEEGSIVGIGGGVPINFYVRKIDKKTVAKSYIAQCYPNGFLDADSVRKGSVGQKGSGGGAE